MTAKRAIPDAEAKDKELEALIDRAGRDAVFAEARAIGWSFASAPPKWVWAEIARTVLMRRQPDACTTCGEAVNSHDPVETQ